MHCHEQHDRQVGKNLLVHTVHEAGIFTDCTMHVPATAHSCAARERA